jgi:uncharacterized DUF497 family protein
MQKLAFTWDEKKNLANQRKHGISFEAAKTVFYDESARMIHDPDHSVDKDRFILLGLSYKLRILVVIHAYKKDDQIIRIIFARKATKIEMQTYSKVQ